MKPMSTDELRQAYLDFFAKKHGHAVIAGASLVPDNDPTVLFTTAGMHPLVPYLMGEKHPAGKRLVDVQRCIRTGDIDEVGDASHLTMFEMMGNWSLGDYFKKEAIAMSFEFLTQVLGIPLEKFAVTCFKGDADAPRDDESADYWKKLGVPSERVGFLPKAKNWWGPAGKTGPCGPDTEMFYWVGPTDLPPPGSNPANDDANWLEIWNDVFIQYNKKEDGTFELLAQQNVDTGMGLERVAAVLQSEPGLPVKSVYDTDAFMPVIKAVESLRKPDAVATNDKRSIRIVADHIKASTFMIADGVRPSNVDQGYVLRRLIRRAVHNGHELGIHESFAASIAESVIQQYGKAYPALAEKKAEIVDVLQKEEAQFKKTLHQALQIFEKKVSVEVADGEMLFERPILSGAEGFDLVTTYGMPLEMVKEQVADRGVHLSETFDEDFQRLFQEHQAKSRAGAAQKFAGGLADHSAETTKLHTATHLLNAALKKVLGSQIQQKGSNITAERLRFDFNYDGKMTPEQIAEVEKLVNEQITADVPVAYHLTSVEGAKNEGAVGVFDDRYGSEVKVYAIGDGSFSKEICGGPHVARTGMIGSFKIQKEESSSAGVRRIKAVVSGGPKEIDVAGEVK